MDVDSFAVFTELIVAITGFSGIALALTRRDRSSADRTDFVP